MPIRRKPLPDSLKSIADFVRYSGRAKATVREWIDTGRLVIPEGGLSHAETDAFMASLKGRNTRTKDDPEQPIDGDTPDYYIERARKMRHSAELEGLKLAHQKGELIPAVEVEREWSGIMGALRANVEGELVKIAPKLAKLPPAQILKELRSAWRRAQEASK
jgi:phage terminase Nu1 subunit (DNA packaging protein)